MKNPTVDGIDGVSCKAIPEIKSLAGSKVNLAGVRKLVVFIVRCTNPPANLATGMSGDVNSGIGERHWQLLE